jgi:hypothetical protein
VAFDAYRDDRSEQIRRWRPRAQAAGEAPSHRYSEARHKNAHAMSRLNEFGAGAADYAQPNVVVLIAL